MSMLKTRSLETAKAGNRPDECEDASRIWVSGSGPARIVVSDGASESAFARDWARILASAFVLRPLELDRLDDASLAEWLAPCGEEWSQVVPWGRLPWHGQAKTRAGAMATLLGLTVDLASDPEGGYAWEAVAIGDCCMFVVRDDLLALSFPLESSGQLNNNPSLICSNPANNRGIEDRVHRMQGQCLPGDLLLLTSDALAGWVLRECEAGRRPWETLLSLESYEAWSAWVAEQRRGQTMRNDDTTLITVEVE